MNMPFQPGQSGNPSGRPAGIADKRVKNRELFLTRAPDLINKAIDMALDGDVVAMKLCIDRIVPKISHNTLESHIIAGDMKDPDELLKVGCNLISEITDGRLNTQNGKALSSILENQRKLIELVDLKNMLEELQELIKNKKTIY